MASRRSKRLVEKSMIESVVASNADLPIHIWKLSEDQLKLVAIFSDAPSMHNLVLASRHLGALQGGQGLAFALVQIPMRQTLEQVMTNKKPQSCPSFTLRDIFPDGAEFDSEGSPQVLSTL